jgi:hypothetical protein
MPSPSIRAPSTTREDRVTADKDALIAVKNVLLSRSVVSHDVYATAAARIDELERLRDVMLSALVRVSAITDRLPIGELHKDVLAAIEAARKGAHSDAAGGSAYDLLEEAKQEIRFYRTKLATLRDGLKNRDLSRAQLSALIPE